VTPGLLVGIFVGGRGSRLGGVAKGLLAAPSSERTLLERLLGELNAALPRGPIVLVGEAEAYASYGLPSVSDSPTGVGPIGGLGGLLRHAHELGAERALALACDLPKIRGGLLSRLAEEAPDAAALVAHQEGVRNPLIARYCVARTLPALNGVVASGKRSLQAVLDALGSEVHLLPQSPVEAASLVDWDTPEDLRGDA
jgi:molybdenum cofactor guanylyltransferase